MYCSACGQAVMPGQAFCPQCGRPVTPAVPPGAPVPNLAYQVESYRGKIRALAIVWFVYAGLSMLFGLAGLTFARHFLSRGFGPMMDGGNPLPWFFPMILVCMDRAGGAHGACYRGRLGPDGERAVGPDRGHHRRHPQPHQVPVWHGHGHLDAGGAARLSKCHAVRTAVRLVVQMVF